MLTLSSGAGRSVPSFRFATNERVSLSRCNKPEFCRERGKVRHSGARLERGFWLFAFCCLFGLALVECCFLDM
jgi:hypothetical protein